MNEDMSYMQFEPKTFDVSYYIHTNGIQETAIIHYIC